MSEDLPEGVGAGKRVVIRPPPRPRTLAGVYIGHAVDALRDAGSPEALYHSSLRSSSAPTDNMSVLLAYGLASDRRAQSSQRAMLFAALAAEAYVNEFIAKHFDGQDYETMDRLSPVEKYVLAPRLALGRTVFDRSHEPAQTLRQLFKHRDVLVHPKPHKGLPATPRYRSGHPRTIEADPTYNPSNALKMILAVADAGHTIVREGQLGDGFDMAAHMVQTGRGGLRRYAERATAELPLPTDSPPPADLLVHAVDPELRKQL